jgi:hypothetical protein
VRETGGYPELAVVVLAQLDADPLSEGRRRTPDVDRDVEHRAPGHAHQLALCTRRELVVQAAQHAPGAAAVVVLHEIDVQTGRLREGLPVEALVEEAPGIAEHLRLEQHDVRNRQSRGLHQ